MRRPHLLEVLLVVIIWALLLAFVLYDTPKIAGAARRVQYMIVDGPLPYPEEDTMHYITREGVLIIYDGHQETEVPDRPE